MEDPEIDHLHERTRILLEPGDIDLVGMIVQTDFDRTAESEMHQATIEIGETIADHLDVGETFVYSGVDDPDFGVNQHQGLTLAEESFVWEVQQLYRENRFVLVFYFEAVGALDDIVTTIEEQAYEVTPVRPRDEARA